jgi:protein-disulfide isomerase
MPTLVTDYVETGKLKYVMRENPIMSIHKRAMPASQAALCAHDQGKYWEMHNMIFENQRELSDENLKSYAATIGLDTAAFNSCLDEEKKKAQVDADLATARTVGVRGTPGFVLGLTDPDDPNKANMTVFINGAQSLDNFKSAIDGLLEPAE